MCVNLLWSLYFYGRITERRIRSIWCIILAESHLLRRITWRVHILVWEGKWSPCPNPFSFIHCWPTFALAQSLSSEGSFWTYDSNERLWKMPFLFSPNCQYVLSSLSQVDLFHLGTTIWFLLQPANCLPSFQFAERLRAEGIIWRVPLTLLAFGTEIFCTYPQNVEDLATWKMTIMSIVEHYAEKAEKLVRIIGKLPSNCLFIRLYFLHQCIKSWNIFPFLQ